MKEVRFLVKELATAAITSAWWGTIVLGNEVCALVALVSTAIVVILGIIYICDHWGD